MPSSFNISWQKESNDEIRDHPLLERRVRRLHRGSPGTCPRVADGDTRMQALENVETVIQEWIETARELGRSIPEPKGRLLFA